jgi:hypothetical protein
MVVVRKGLTRIRHGSMADNYVIAPRNLDSSFDKASNTLAKLSIETAFSSISFSDNKVLPSILAIST